MSIEMAKVDVFNVLLRLVWPIEPKNPGLQWQLLFSQAKYVAWALTWNAKPKRALGASTPFRLDLVVYAASC